MPHASPSEGVTTIAIVQPYFVPYAGYFRLFAAADVVVMFDCAQFPRRGWVHRNRLPIWNGELDWLTLSLVKADRDVRIADLAFQVDARARLEESMRRFPVLERARRSAHPLIERILRIDGPDAATYICDLVADLTRAIGVERTMVRSSTLDISDQLRGAERVIAIARAFGARRYVNPSGGRELYDRQVFANAGLELAFLSPYGGATASVLGRLLDEEPVALKEEIVRETILVP